MRSIRTKFPRGLLLLLVYFAHSLLGSICHISTSGGGHDATQLDSWVTSASPVYIGLSHKHETAHNPCPANWPFGCQSFRACRRSKPPPPHSPPNRVFLIGAAFSIFYRVKLHFQTTRWATPLTQWLEYFIESSCRNDSAGLLTGVINRIIGSQWVAGLLKDWSRRLFPLVDLQ